MAMIAHLSRRNATLISIAAFALLLLVIVLAIGVGAYDIGVVDLLSVLFGASDAGTEHTARDIVLNIRIPRVLMAAGVGAGLSVAGVIFQVLLRNVLADPYILGVSGGASVGALLSIVTGLSGLWLWAQPIAAMLGAAMVIVLVAFIGLRKRAGEHGLLLSGVMIGAFLSAIILGLVSVMDSSVRNALYWLIGYFGNSTLDEVRIVLPLIVLAFFLAMLAARSMNVLALGQEAASHLGLHVSRLRVQLFLLASLLTASVVAFSGAVGFVGLVVPHLCRTVTGPDHRVLLPAAFFTGGIFMVVADIVARTVLGTVELPVGAVTAALGAPLFLLLLLRRPR